MSVLFLILPIIAIATLGYLALRFSLITEEENAALEKITLYLLMPGLLFLGTARVEFPEVMNWSYLLGFYGVVVLMYGLGVVIGALFFGYNLRQQSVFAMGFSYSNVTVLGIPVTVQILGEEAFLPLFLIIAIHNLFQFTLGTLTAELKQQGDGRISAKLLQAGLGLLKNPIILSLLAGLGYNLTGLPLAGWLFETLDMLSGAAVPLALFMVGASLTRYHITGELLPSVFMVAGKLLLFPALMMFVMFHVLEVDPVWASTAVLLSAMPVGISVYVFSRQYRECEAQAAAGIVFSSLLLVVSLSIVVAVLQS